MTDVKRAPEGATTTVEAADAARNGAGPGGAHRGVDTPPPVPRVDKRDPRYLALRNFAISMSILNILGYTILGFEQPWTWPLFVLALGYTVELVIEAVAARSLGRRPAYSGNGAWGVYTFLLPTHITALAVNMLLYANDMFWPIAFAVVVAIGQKAVLQAPINGRMRHFMNPSNFGITIALLTFSWVNVAPPYHFTENVPDVFRMFIPMVVLTAGTILNAMLTKKVALIVGWVGGFVIQALIRHYVWDVQLWSALSIMTGVAFVLFTNYMITDPGTTPSKARNQFMFGSSVAMVYGLLMVFNVVYTLFFAVTIVCLARGLFWWVKWLMERRGERTPVQPVPPPAAVELPIAR
ncbi:enediyne biosynthesis protein [Micromonospora sp. RP3T]|uniref:enediyne biosynthesis protein n=1 Tax=Micromonospora sp. RP3T TaxID=2135446 RepID=UPI000D178103|nr:enediyne biosynthesis protein [Micromonospora sp. RP3T]PTA47776.1 enediyne biosynthesis protein [Micromonospora sp. RP3T]